MRFSAPWDRTLRISTALALSLLTLVAAAMLYVASRTGPWGWAFVGVGILLLAATPALAWALAPRGFALEAGAVRVLRVLRPVSIPIAAIRAAGALPPRPLRGLLRLGGSGGLFGWYGRCWTRSLGAFQLFATRLDGLVRLDNDDERFVLSPGDPGRFLAELAALAPDAAAAGALPPERRPVPRRTKLALAALVAAVPLAVAAVLLASFAHAPRAVRVGADAILVERRWAGPDEIPLAEVRGATVLPPEALRGLRRTAGFALGDTAYGRFQSPYLGCFHLYAWRRGPAVLVATEGERLVVTPEDPQRFADEVNAALGARYR
ncbi:MAG TPA: PH domain-containing protein [Anaeromyxobacter sp.]